MRGIKFQAMVLAASNDDHTEVRKNTQYLFLYKSGPGSLLVGTLNYENCFSDIHNFTMTQIKYLNVSNDS